MKMVRILLISLFRIRILEGKSFGSLRIRIRLWIRNTDIYRVIKDLDPIYRVIKDPDLILLDIFCEICECFRY